MPDGNAAPGTTFVHDPQMPQFGGSSLRIVLRGTRSLTIFRGSRHLLFFIAAGCGRDSGGASQAIGRLGYPCISH
jgi:hypothetical protein